MPLRRTFLTTNVAIICVLLARCTAPNVLAEAASPGAVPHTISYLFGDNPRWAEPGLDDSGWEDGRGRWLLPPFDSDGFVWMRTRVTIPLNVNEPLAVRLAIGGTHPGAVTVYVNGRAAGTEGGFPPQGAPEYLPATAVFDVPTGAAAPGSTAVVAVRMWYMPRSRPMSRSFHATTGFLENTGSVFGTSGELTIDSATTLRAVDRSERLSKLLGSMPDLAVNALLCLAGLALIVFWRWTRRAELAWCSALLISDSAYEYFFVATDQGYLFFPLQLQFRLKSCRFLPEACWVLVSGLDSLARFRRLRQLGPSRSFLIR